jgi:hypothetical protein
VRDDAGALGLRAGALAAVEGGASVNGLSDAVNDGTKELERWRRLVIPKDASGAQGCQK